MAKVSFIDESAILKFSYLERRIFGRRSLEVELIRIAKVELTRIPKTKLLGQKFTISRLFGGKKGGYLFESKKRMILGRFRQPCVRISLFNPNFDEIWIHVKYPGELVDQLAKFLRIVR